MPTLPFRPVLLCILLLSGLATAQEFNASISGIATDPSGAAIPGVTVTGRNIKTNVLVRSKTGADGNYVLVQLPTGTYELTAEAPGFRKYIRQGITLSIGDRAQVDAPMQLGQASESVTVSAELGAVEANQSVMGLVTDERTVSEVPLAGRQVFELLLDSAGVVFTSTAAQNPMNTAWDVHGNYSIKGSRPTTNSFLMDGAPLGARGIWTGSPLVDAVEEFKVASPVTDASYGISGGGVVSIKMKSGTNELHGSFSEYLQNIILDANSTQANRASAQAPYLKNQNTQNSFSGRLGGPIVRNKLFFTGYYEGTRMRQGRPFTVTLPTMEQRAGDFSKTLNATGQLIVVNDPLTTHQVGNRYVRDAFPGNVIPQSRIASPSRNIMKLVPEPNIVTDPVTNFNNYAAVPNSRMVTTDTYYMKADYLWNQSNRTMVSETYAPNSNYNPANNGLPRGNPTRNAGLQTRTHYGATIDHVWYAGHELTVDARVAWDRFVQTTNAVYSQDFDGSQLGFAGRIGSSPVNRFPVLNFTDYIAWGNAGNELSPDDLYSAVVDASKVLKRHVIRFGGRAAQARFSRSNRGAWYGNFTFNRVFTQTDAQRADTTSGNSMASFLLGYPASGYTEITPDSTYQNKAFGLYIQDDIKLMRRLTVNAGLRWDAQTAPTERFDRQIYSFDPDITYQLGPGQAKGGFVYADRNHRQPWNTKWRDFQPRVGVAFRMTKWLTWRGGYGTSFLPVNGALGGGGIQQDGFSRRTNMVVAQGSGANLYTPGRPGMGTFVDPFPDGILEPYGSALGPKTMVGQAVSYVTRDFEIGRVRQFFAGFGLDLPWRMSAEVSYVGTRTRDLRISVNQNPIPLDEQAKGAADPNYLNAALPNPFYGAPELVGTSLGTATLTRGQSVRPYPQFTTVTDTGVPWGNSSYNGLEMRLQRRMSRELMVRLNYTFSKTIEALSYREQIRDVPRVLAAFDRPQSLTMTALWELPLGKGRRIGSNWGKTLNMVLGGWQYNTVFTYQAGIPISMPSAVVASDPSLPQGQQSLKRWFNTCTLLVNGTRANCASPDEPVAWIQPAPGQVLNNSSNLPNIRTHSLPRVNMSLFKKFTIRERARLELRGETFNATNTPIYGAPGTGLTSPNFGVVVADQVNLPRYVQVALKLLF